MKQSACLVSCLALLAFLGLFVLGGAATAAEVRTNWVDRWVTNAVEVYVPANRFVTEYHTNVVLRTHTNVMNVFATNLVTTCRTNHVEVNLVRTNFVQAYRTNYKDLNLTNWTTVVVFKTNWVQQTFTNLVEVGLGTKEAAKVPPAQDATAPIVAGAAAEPALTIQVTRGPKQSPNQTDVGLTVRSAKPDQSSVRVVQWKVQSEDGSILCFGEEPQFRRNLPFGNYRVEVKARREGKTDIVTARATLSVGAREVRLFDQRMLARR